MINKIKVQFVITGIEGMIDCGELHHFERGGSQRDAILYICELENLSESETEEVKKHFDIED